MDEFPSHWDPLIDPEWEKTAGKRIREELDRRLKMEEERLVRIGVQPLWNRAFIPKLPIPEPSTLTKMPSLSISEASRLISRNLFTGTGELNLYIQINSPEEPGMSRKI